MEECHPPFCGLELGRGELGKCGAGGGGCLSPGSASMPIAGEGGNLPLEGRTRCRALSQRVGKPLGWGEGERR